MDKQSKLPQTDDAWSEFTEQLRPDLIEAVNGVLAKHGVENAFGWSIVLGEFDAPDERGTHCIYVANVNAEAAVILLQSGAYFLKHEIMTEAQGATKQ